MEKSNYIFIKKDICHILLFYRNTSKPLKRLQSSLPLDKSTKYDENHPRLCKSDSSLLSPDSNSPPLHNTITDLTTPTYINNSVGEHEQDSDTANFNFPPMYPHQFPYNPYPNDSSSMIYNPYIGSTSRSAMNFSSYGYYPTPVYQTNNYNTPFF
jgi:hypothetical protein